LSGNLSFLNWLTIIPALACFDDGFWARILPAGLVRRAEAAATAAEPSAPMQAAGWLVAALVAALSIAPVRNLISPQQVMNTSFNALDLVNTYGAFGSVGQVRGNVVLEGTDSATPDERAAWKPYPYKGLPVALDRRPPQIAPYQLRLDWQMWFASMSSVERYPWTLNLVWKLLHNDPDTLGLFAGNPFPARPPRYIRAVLYQYAFVRAGDPSGRWWRRQTVGLWISPVSVDTPGLRTYLTEMGWAPAAQ
jgi:hypothetical protein